MKYYYVDFETTGLNPKESKIISIQFQEINDLTGNAETSLTILKSWESSEKEIIQKFIERLQKVESKWDFVIVGYNIKFERDFLLQRAKFHNLKEFDLFSDSFILIDLHSCGIMMNHGAFKGSGLDKISNKTGNGIDCMERYVHEDYEGVENYIKQETKAFIELFKFLRDEMPLLKEKLRKKL